MAVQRSTTTDATRQPRVDVHGWWAFGALTLLSAPLTWVVLTGPVTLPPTTVVVVETASVVLLAGLVLGASVLARATGDVAAVRAAQVAGLLAGATLLGALLRGVAPDGFAAVALGAELAVLVLLVLTLRGRASLGPRPWRLPPAVVGVGVSVTVLVAVAQVGEPLLAGVTVLVTHAVIAAVATVAAVRAAAPDPPGVFSRDHLALLPWLTWPLAGLALYHAALAVGGRAVGPLLAAGVVARTAGATVGVVGVLRALVRTIERQQERTRVLQEDLDERARRHREDAEQLAHEAQNALTVLELASRTLIERHDQLNAAQRDQLATAFRNEVRRLGRLVRPDVIAETATGVAGIVEREVAVARTRGIEIRLDPLPEVDVAVPDEVLSDALANVLGNVGRHGVGVDGTARAYAHARVRGGALELTVDDDGPGLDVDDPEIVFARGWTRTGQPGHGLGLHIARQRLRDAGGELAAAASPSGGARLTLRLPLTVAADPAPAGQLSADRRRGSDQAGTDRPHRRSRLRQPPLHRPREVDA